MITAGENGPALAGRGSSDGGVEQERHRRGYGRPVPPGRRIASVDVLRGFALCGILVMNIQILALPLTSFSNPLSSGGFEGRDRVAWWVARLLFDYKMMPIFAMLFGAGLVLMHEKSKRYSQPLGIFWYRRNALLMIIGLLHGYLLWLGDILFLYGFCGLWLYFFRRKSSSRLFAAAAVFFSISVLILFWGGHYMDRLKREAPRIERRIESGENVGREERVSLKRWKEIESMLYPSEEDIDEIVRTYRDGYSGMIRYRAPIYFSMTTYMMLMGSFPPTMGLMLLGMGLMKLEVFSARRSRRFYLLMSSTGYAAGCALALAGGLRMISRNFDPVEVAMYDSIFNHLGGPMVALGHTGLVMLACGSGALALIRKALAAVGRMALSNYISQSVICVAIFHGIGLGQYGRFDRAELMLFAACIWIIQLTASTLWLSRFEFGPLEWLWRSLTYGKAQRMRKAC